MMQLPGTILEIRQYGTVQLARVRVVDSVYLAGNPVSEYVAEFLPPHKSAGRRVALNYRDVARVISVPVAACEYCTAPDCPGLDPAAHACHGCGADPGEPCRPVCLADPGHDSP
jgi:hypothetical protein